ncbi:MAG: hypothetical protein ABR541_05230 [Candidatus Dormibacteria bacterium]
MRLQDMLEWSAQLAGCAEIPADSQVYIEAEGDIERLLVGVDIGVPELLYAQQAGFDAVLAHHPVGDRAVADFGLVVRRQFDQMTAEGVPAEAAERAIAARLAGRHRAEHMSNVNRTVDTARLIGMPLANIHLAADILGRQAVVDLLLARDSTGATVADALSWFDDLPEMRAALHRPEAWVGEPASPLGRWTVAMAGGTNGGHPVFREYYRAGVDTIFCMHIAEGDLLRLREEAPANANLVVTGHMATDSVGLNRVIAGLEQRGIAVTRTSGILEGAPPPL